MRSFIKWIFLFVAGGMLYYIMEMLFRGRSHWTMMIVGGVCFLICGALNEGFDFKMPLIRQGVICAAMITDVEFIAGYWINIVYGLNVWDYSNMPFNLLGQICLPFSLLWIPVGILAVVVDDYLRYWIFAEEQPHYRIW